jgi:hypothetical protein
LALLPLTLIRAGSDALHTLPDFSFIPIDLCRVEMAKPAFRAAGIMRSMSDRDIP